MPVNTVVNYSNGVPHVGQSVDLDLKDLPRLLQALLNHRRNLVGATGGCSTY
jgi:hypothetical protein